MKISKIKSIYAAMLLVISLSSSANVYAGPEGDFFKGIEDFYLKKDHSCPTLAYIQNGVSRYSIYDKLIQDCRKVGIVLSNSPYFCRTYVENELSFYSNKIDEYFSSLIDNIIKREKEYTDSHFVFYHGQDRQFSLFYDLFNGLNHLINNERFTDFYMLRVPDTDNNIFYNYQDTIDFRINNYNFETDCYTGLPIGINDHIPEIRRQLLAVSPSLFGEEGESAYSQVLESCSPTCSDDNEGLFKEDYIKFIFKFFGETFLFKKYEECIRELIKLLYDEGNLIESSGDLKTGNLLQIFIPKNKVDQVVYASGCLGNPIPTTGIVNVYSSYVEKIRNCNTYEDLHEIDQTQFRLLINNDVLLNPESGVKIFRYTNETENMRLYRQKLQELMTRIRKDLGVEKIDKN